MKKLLRKLYKAWDLFCLRHRIGKYKRMYCKNCVYYEMKPDAVYAEPKAFCNALFKHGHYLKTKGEGRCELFKDKERD